MGEFVRANSFQIGDFKPKLMQPVIVSRSVVQLSDLKCPSPAHPVLPSAPMKTIALKAPPGSFLRGSCSPSADIHLTHPHGLLIISLLSNPVGRVLIALRQSIPCWAFQTLNPNGSLTVSLKPFSEVNFSSPST